MGVSENSGYLIGVFKIRILRLRVLYKGPLFRKPLNPKPRLGPEPPFFLEASVSFGLADTTLAAAATVMTRPKASGEKFEFSTIGARFGLERDSQSSRRFSDSER